MKALSLKQPFATLIAGGDKTLETRNWKTDYRGPLLICSSKSVHNGMFVLDGYDLECAPLVKAYGLSFPKGMMLFYTQLLNCRRMTVDDEPAACCRLYPGAWAWELGEVVPVQRRYVKGMLNLFDVDDNLIKIDDPRNLPTIPQFYRQQISVMRKDSKS